MPHGLGRNARLIDQAEHDRRAGVIFEGPESCLEGRGLALAVRCINDDLGRIEVYGPPNFIGVMAQDDNASRHAGIPKRLEDVLKKGPTVVGK